ncbi:MAG: hypothetical protein INR65_02035 [Gluconacetobacter diazotrophicus]|nr:hypothetical protein [Gluconacetobacter diazotrophicus]
MRRSVAIGGGAVVLLALVLPGCYLAALRIGERDLAAATARIRTELGPGGSLDYANAVIHPLSRSAVLERVVLRDASGVTLAVDRLDVSPGAGGRIRGLRASPFRLSTPDGTLRAATLEVSGLSLPSPGPAGRIDPAAARFADAELRNAVVEASGSVLTLGDLRVADYGRDRPTRIDASNVVDTLSAPRGPARLTAGDLHATGLDAASLIALAEGGARPVRPPPGDTTVVLHRLAVTQAGTSLGGIDELRGQTRRDAAGNASSRVAGTGLVIVPPDPDAAARLRSLGLDTLHGSFGTDGSYRRADGVLRVSSASLSLDRIGVLDLGVELDGMIFDPSTVPPADRTAAAARAVMAGRLSGLHLRFTDRGLLSALFDAAARNDGMPASVLRARLADALPRDLRLAALLPDPAQLQAVAAFLRDGGTLELRLDPRPPIVLKRLAAAAGDPAALLASLNLSAVHDPAGPVSSGL